MNFYITPEFNIAVNPKCGTTSLAKAIAETFYAQDLNNAKENFTDDYVLSEQEYKGFCPVTQNPDKPIVMLMRDPVDKFLAVCAMKGIDIDTALREYMETEYFLPQSRFNADEVYKFPDEIEQFCSKVKLPYPLPICNEGVVIKPVPTKEQLEAIEAYYADDIKLFNSL